MSGTAADGAPLSAATLVLKDWAGHTVETKTRADGRYSVDARQLVAPFLLLVDDGQGARYYGVATARGTSNLTPFSQVIVESLARSYESDPDSLFADPTSFDPPSRHAVELIESTTRSMIGPWLSQRGLDPETFNLLSTPFAANASGFNALLATVSLETNAFLIDDGTRSQESWRLKSPGDVHGFQSTLVTPEGSCSTWIETRFPVGFASPLETALDGVGATLSQLRAIVNAGGAGLVADALLPLIDPDCLDDGNDQEFLAAQLATLLRGVRIDATRIVRVIDASSDGTLVDAEFELLGQHERHAVRHLMRQRFLQDGAGEPWRLHGNGQIAGTQVTFERRFESGPGGSYAYNWIDVEARARAGVVDELFVSTTDWPPLFDDFALPFRELWSGVLAPTPTSTLAYSELRFGTTADPTNFTPIGTRFDFTLLPTGGGLPVTYSVDQRGFTTESLEIVAPAGNELADAKPGQQLEVSWKRPTTFVPIAIRLTGECTSQGGTHVSTMGSDEPLAPTDTMGHLTFPTEHGGFPIDSAKFRLEIVGAGGEQSAVEWHFSDFS